MKTLIACFLCLLFHQAVFSNLPILEHASEVGKISSFSSELCQVDGLIGCTDDCKAQRFCLNKRELIIDCLKQTGKPNCDHNTSECTSDVTCPENEEPVFVCPGVGYYPHPLDCSRLWQCPPKGKAKELQCNSGLVFDPLNKKCSSGIRCYTFSYTDGLCKGKTGLMVTHPLNKGLYVYCDGGFPQIQECPANLIFDIGKMTCEFECKARGVFKDPVEYQCYYVCTKVPGSFKKEHKCCLVGEIFDDNLSACVPL